MHIRLFFWLASAVSFTTVSCSCSGLAIFPLQDPDTLNAECPTGTHFGLGSFVCCPEGTDLDLDPSIEAYVCCPPSEPNCGPSIVPNSLRCADAGWSLWTRAFSGSMTACCMQGYYPSVSRYCIQGSPEDSGGTRYSMVNRPSRWICVYQDNPTALVTSDPCAGLKFRRDDNPSACTSTTPLKPTRTGLPCNLVQNAAKAYTTFKANGNAGIGFWGQVLNLVCLGALSSCTDTVPECSRTKALESLKSLPADCNPADIPEDGFEAFVFNGFLGGNNLNLDEVAETARQAQLDANLMALAIQKDITENRVDSLERLLYSLARLDDPNLIGTVQLGYNHFLQELGPLFEKYIINLVSSATSVKDLNDKIDQLQAQHHHLFNCQVIPGFAIQDATGEIPSFNAWVAQVIVPIAAAGVRNIELWNAISKRVGLPGLLGLVKSWFRKRGHNSHEMSLARRGSWDENITSSEDYFLALGYIPPLSPTLRTHLVNWAKSSPSPPDVGPAEFSSFTRNDTTSITVMRTLGNVSITLVSSTSSSPGDGLLDDLVAFVGLVPSSFTVANTALIPSVNQSVVIVGPMILIWPNNVELMPLRNLQDLGNGTNSTASSTINENNPLTPEQSATAEAVNASSFEGFATTEYLKVADQNSQSLFYKQASLSVTVAPSMFGQDASNLVLVDLLSGNALGSTATTDSTDADKVVLNTDLKPGAGGGMWEGGLNGGGMYGVGIIGPDGNLVRTLPD